jgi:predicted extracellular nuclease
MKLKYPALLAALCASAVQASDLVITGVIDGPLPGGLPKAIELFVLNDVPDLSYCGVGSANNAGGSDGQEFTFTSVSATAGTYIYVSKETEEFANFMGFNPTYKSNAADINGDDSIELFCGGLVVDVFGEVGVDGSNHPWEYLDGWAYRSAETGPDGNEFIFGNWTFSGKNALDNETKNLTAATPFPAKTYTGLGDNEPPIDEPPSIESIVPNNGTSGVALDANISLTFSEPVTISAYNAITCLSEASITVTATGEGTSYVLNPDQEFASGDSCSFTVSAADVTDLDGTADNMAEDFTIAFNVIDNSIVVNLVINEFHADPASGVSGDANGDGTRETYNDEFVEIVNFGEADLNLSGWTLSDEDNVKHTFPADTIVEAGCAVVVFGGGTPQGVFGGALVQTASNGGVSLNNPGDIITLTNGAKTFEVVYGSEGGDNQSVTLNPDVTGETFSKHSQISEANGALFSPGTKLDGTKFAGCTLPDFAPTIVEFKPTNGATEVGIDSNIKLTFSEPVTVSQWPNLVCDTSGQVVLDGALSGTEFSLTPAIEFNYEETCTFTLPAASVADEDGTPDNMASDFVNSFTTGELLVCNTPDTLISAIQGNGASSSLVGQTVLVQAIVTAVLPNSNAFFVQEEDADADADPATSEGIFVYNDNEFNMPAVGDVVMVKGVVSEFFNRTQITLFTTPYVCSQNAILPSATSFSLPLVAMDDLEVLEGMLVTSSQSLVVTNNYDLGKFGQVTLSTERLFTPTNVFAPGSSEADALAVGNSLNRIMLDDGDSNTNPDVVVFPTGDLSAVNTLRTGDSVTNLTGVVDYSYGVYRVVPTQEPTFVATNARTSAPDLNFGNVKVASANVLNLFNGDGLGGGYPTSRGADNEAEYERQLAKTVAALIAIDAGIVGLMEIENDGYAATSAIVQLVAALNAQAGEDTYAFVNAGGQIGTDAIALGILYQPSKVSPVGTLQINNDAIFNRPPIAQTFALVANGQTITVVPNHFKSKSGCSSATGLDADQSDGQSCYNATRVNQSNALLNWIATDANLSAQSNVLIMGDLNAYAKEDPITAITSNGYVNLIEQFQGNQGYSYNFGGEAGYLDHGLASASLAEKAVDTTEWHINADEPIVLDYNLENKTSQQQADYYAADPYRASDHDPVVMSFDLQAEEEAVTGDVDGNGVVDMNDYYAFIASYGSSEGDAAYNTAADMNADGVINMTDFQLWYQAYVSQ